MYGYIYKSSSESYKCRPLELNPRLKKKMCFVISPIKSRNHNLPSEGITFDGGNSKFLQFLSGVTYLNVFFIRIRVWNGKPIKLILDHINGVNTDNRTKNLHLLCPNCDSQQLRTRGGANKNRVEKSTGGFSIKEKDGKKKYTLPAESADFSININDASLIYSKEKQE